MTVTQLINQLHMLPPQGIIIGQYCDSNGSWPIGFVELAKVPGDNELVVIQIRMPGAL